MALARVQATPKASVSGVTTVSVSFSTLPAVGNGIIVGVYSGIFAGIPAGACSDNQGNTYVRVRNVENGVVGLSLAYYLCSKIATSSGTFTVTVNPAAGSTNFTAVAIEVSGVGGGLALDSSTANWGISASATATIGITVNANTFQVASIGINSTQASITITSADSPAWTQEIENLSSPGIVCQVDYRIVTTVSAANDSWSWPSSDWNTFGVVAFYATAAPPSASNERTQLSVSLG